jgi:hypothetical protein
MQHATDQPLQQQQQQLLQLQQQNNQPAVSMTLTHSPRVQDQKLAGSHKRALLEQQHDVVPA